MTGCLLRERDIPREIQPLFLQIVVEAFLYLFQELVGLLQAAQHVVLAGHNKSMRVLHTLSHNTPPRAVHYPKLAALLGHLCHDVLRGEYGLWQEAEECEGV